MTAIAPLIIAAPGDAEFALAGFRQGATRNTLMLKGSVPRTARAPDPTDRVQKFWLVAADGRRLEGRRDRGTYSSTTFTATY
jgi:hypothetical protein